MRHGVKKRKLSRTHSHRAALMNSLTTSLLKHKRIRTTLAKAKEVRKHVEPLITKAKQNTLHSRRHVMRFVNDKEVVKELFGDIIQKVGDRPGGYTRVIKIGNRLGDAASMAILELVDYNDVISKKAEEQKEKREAKKEAKEKAKVEETAAEPVEEKKPESKKEKKAPKKAAKKPKAEKKEKEKKETKPKKKKKKAEE